MGSTSKIGGLGYLTDIWDTAPSNTSAASPAQIPLGQFAHHTRLVYAQQSEDAIFSYAAIWRERRSALLVRVDVTSADFAAQNTPRHLVRRYELEYTAPGASQYLRHMLTRAYLTGACQGFAEDDAFSVPYTSECSHQRTIAQMTYTGGGQPITRLSNPNLTPFQHTSSPGVGFSFFDVDSDGLTDIVAGGNVGVETINARTVGIQTVTIDPPSGGFTLGANINTVAALGALGDWTGDGHVDVLWWARDSTNNNILDSGDYTVFTPRGSALSGFSWVGGTKFPTPLPADWVTMMKDVEASHQLIDLDGDGLSDAFSYTPPDPKKSPNGSATLFFSTRAADGHVAPFSSSIAKPTVPYCPDKNQPGINQALIGDPAIGDFSGDGVPDQFCQYLHSPTPGSTDGQTAHWEVYYGSGTGEVSAAHLFAEQSVTPEASKMLDETGRFLHDLNGDGVVDKVELLNAVDAPAAPGCDTGQATTASAPGTMGIDISLGTGSDWLPVGHVCPVALTNWALQSDDANGKVIQPMHIDFADIYGEGIDNLIVTSGAAPNLVVHFALIGAVRPGLLNSISNGIGATTTFDYERVENIPGTVHRVHSVTVSSNADAAQTGGPFVTTYDYADPVYDNIERQFRGYRTVRSTVQGVDAQSAITTETKYLIGSCKDSSGNETPCSPMVDNPQEALRGLPVDEDRYDGAGVHLSKVHTQYQMRKLYTGMDGRSTRMVNRSQTTTTLYDASNFVSGSQSVSDIYLDSEELGQLSETYTLASTTRTVTTRSSQVVDSFGNVTSITDEGVVASNDPASKLDRPIVRVNEWTLPPGDTSHWLWRMRDNYVRESLSGPNLRHVHVDYDALGQPQTTYGDLSGTVSLDRFHEDPNAVVAPAPGDASRDGANQITSVISYDAFGNATQVRSGNGARCSSAKFDDAYSQLPVSHTVYTHGCGGTGLTRSTIYDRGFEMPTMMTTPDGAVSISVYDEFGRVTQVFAPDPTMPGIAESVPTAKISYIDYPDGPYQWVLAQYRDDDGTSPTYRSTWSWTDPYGQVATVVREADPSAGDQRPYIVTDQVERDTRGAMTKRYQARFATLDPGAPIPPPLGAGTPFTRAVHDSFGRLIQAFGLDGQAVSKAAYHALSRESFDASDLQQGATPRPTLTVRDGHGRRVSTSRTTNQSGSPDTVTTSTTYLPTGEVSTIIRSHTAGGDTYTRQMQYDSFGRMVENIEPNTSTGIGTTGMKAWRYVYNDVGDVVGTSDARGCGKNSEWDGAGRLVSERYSPCLKNQPAYTDNLTTLFIYDAPEQGQDVGASASFFTGKLAASYDRAQHARFTYDGRARTIAVARQLAVPNDLFGSGGGIGIGIGICIGDCDGGTDGGATQGGEYAPHWYKTATAYDEVGRTIASSMGADVAELQGASVTAGNLTGTDLVATRYTARGVANHIGGSYGDLVTSKIEDADGLVQSQVFGDIAQTTATYTYNTKQWLLSSTLSRSRPKIWDSPPQGYTPPPKDAPSTAQTILQDLHFDVYDAVGNALSVSDKRIAAEWPAGAQPVPSTALSYDDEYKLRRVDYTYASSGGNDTQISPFAAETNAFPPNTHPVPGQALTNRVRSQAFDFDWQGNLTKSDDDVHAFYDRSMGTITHGSATNGPNRATGSSGDRGHAQVSYDAAGNMTELTLSKLGPDGDSIDIDLTYTWDEVGNLVKAARAPIFGVFADFGLEFHYVYDASGQRVTKSVEDPNTLERRYTSDVFPSLRLNMARFDLGGGDYERTPDDETLYLVSGDGKTLGRVIYDSHGSLPSANGSQQHVYFTMTDPLGSTSVVVDKGSSELVERATYQAYGATESDYRPTRWGSFREDYRFTGKEDDIGVGLTYFGARYYVPALGQWASADPLTIHGLGADLNPYAYVYGSPRQLTDPLGLMPPDTNQTTNAGDDGSSYSSGGFDPTAQNDADPLTDRGVLLCGPTTTCPTTVIVAGEPEGNIPPDPGRTASVADYQAAEATRVYLEGPSTASRRPIPLAERVFIAVVESVGCLLGCSEAAAPENANYQAPKHVSYGQQAFNVGTMVPSPGLRIFGGVLGAILRDAAPAVRDVAERIFAESLAADESALATGGCFIAGTPVTTCDGSQEPIESIHAGDAVLSWNESTGAVECRQVAKTTVRVSHELEDLSLSDAAGVNEIVHTTAEHPFWVQGKGWTAARELAPGERVRTAVGGDAGVEERLPKFESAMVYNFEVEGNHSYFVGALQTLVHNTCPQVRADEIHSVLDPIAQDGRTTAVLRTKEGFDIVAGGVRDIDPIQRGVMRPGELEARLPGEHAEPTALQYARQNGLTPKELGASRDFCANCIRTIEQSHGTITGPRTATWED